MKQLLFILFLLTTISISDLHAQRYGTALGFRGGREGIGITLQQRIFPKTTIEGMFVFSQEQYALTALYEYHHPIVFKSFNYYAGAGLHIGRRLDDEKKVFGGFDGLLGIECKLPIFPMLFSIDIKPAFHLNHPKAVELHAGFSMRYILVTHRQLKKKKRAKERQRKKSDKEEQKLERKKQGKETILDKMNGILKKKDAPQSNKKPSSNKKQTKKQTFWEKIKSPKSNPENDQKYDEKRSQEGNSRLNRKRKGLFDIFKKKEKTD